MKLMLGRQWLDLCQVVLLVTAAFSRLGATALGESRRLYRFEEADNLRKDHQHSFAGKPFYVMGLQLLAGLGLLSSVPAMAEEPVGMVKTDSAAIWNLTETTVVNKGQADMLTEGELVHDFVIESKATATSPSGSVVPAGTFKLVLSAFSPAYDQRGQKKGIWYVWGKWSLTDARISGSGNARQRTGALSGQLSAELAFNPIVSPQNWTAKVRVPMTRIAPVAQTESNQAISRTARGEGALTMDNKHEGKMSLNLMLGPQLQH